MIQPALPPGTKFVYIYIDNSNLWIQGKKTHAKRMLDPSMLTDNSWRFDVGKLREVIVRNSDLYPSWEIYRHKTTLYGSIPPPNDSVWGAIRAHDVEVKIFPRSQHNNREKQVDGQLIADAVKKAGISSYMRQECEFVIVSGDLDFKPAVLEIAKCGFRVHVWSWKYGMAGEYAQLLHTGTKTGLVRVHCLDSYLDFITLGKPERLAQPNISNTHGFVILNPAPMMDEIKWYLSTLEARVMFKRYWSLLQWQPSHNFDIVIIPERIITLEWWDSLVMEVKMALDSVGVVVITLSQYTKDHPLWRTGRGESPLPQPWTNPPLIGNGYSNPNRPHHWDVTHAVHHPDAESSIGWFDDNSWHRTNGIPPEPRKATTYPWRTPSTEKQPFHQNETAGAKIANGQKENRRKRMCPFGKACMNGKECSYNHS